MATVWEALRETRWSDLRVTLPSLEDLAAFDRPDWLRMGLGFRLHPLPGERTRLPTRPSASRPSSTTHRASRRRPVGDNEALAWDMKTSGVRGVFLVSSTPHSEVSLMSRRHPGPGPNLRGQYS